MTIQPYTVGKLTKYGVFHDGRLLMEHGTEEEAERWMNTTGLIQLADRQGDEEEIAA